MRGGTRRSSTLGEQIVEAAHATEERLQTMRAAAALDADRLIVALAAESASSSTGIQSDSHRQGSPHVNTLLSFQPRTYSEQVRYLEMVAHEFDRWRSRRRSNGVSGATPASQNATPSSV